MISITLPPETDAQRGKRERMLHARKYRPQDNPPPAHPLERKKAVVLPPMGDQPEIKAAVASRPPETPNPYANAFEPIVAPQRVIPAKFYGEKEVRRVVEAEIDELMSWGMIRFRVRYPRCQPENVRPMLQLATRGGRMAFLRTDNACGMFYAEITPWEPELVVHEVFVVSRKVVPREVLNLYKAGREWAREIGAVEYEFGSSTGIDITAIARRVGYNHEMITNQSFTIQFDKGAPAPEDQPEDQSED